MYRTILKTSRKVHNTICMLIKQAKWLRVANCMVGSFSGQLWDMCIVEAVIGASQSQSCSVEWNIFESFRKNV